MIITHHLLGFKHNQITQVHLEGGHLNDECVLVVALFQQPYLFS